MNICFEILASLEEVGHEKSKEIVASLQPLKDAFIDYSEDADSDLLAFAGNLFVANLPNKNDAIVTKEDALKYYKTLEKKFLDLEHKRTNIIGFIESVFLTDFNTSEIISEETAQNLNVFNVGVRGYIWKKTIGSKLAKFIVDASDPTSENYNKVSLSFEWSFDYYDIVKYNNGIIEIPQEEQESFAKLLKHNKGKGVDKEGNRIVRRIRGDQYGSGAGLVPVPAAEVKGIAILEKEAEYDEDDNDDEDDKEDNNTEDSHLLISEDQPQKQKTSVTHNKTLNNFMPKTLEELKANWDELAKKPEEAFASVASFIADSIKDKSAEFEASLKEKEDAKLKAEQSAAELKASLESSQQKIKEQEEALSKVNAKLADIEKAQELAAKQERFNNRMAEFDSIFDLDDEDRGFLKDDLLNLDEEAYAAYKGKMKKMMKEKTKAYKAEVKEKVKAACDKKGLKASVESADISEVFASLEVTTPSASVTNGIEPNVNLKKDLEQAFKKHIKVSKQ